jgi:hypothetical protein
MCLSHLCSDQTRWRTSRSLTKSLNFFGFLQCMFYSFRNTLMQRILCMRTCFRCQKFISTMESTRNVNIRKPIEWNDLIRWLDNGQRAQLWRDEHHSQRYHEHQRSVLCDYRSINDYIRIHYLKWNVCIDPTSQKRTAIMSSASIREPILTVNRFPYDLAHGIQHWLVWCDPKPNEPEKIISNVLNREFPSDRFDRISFINPPRLRSIPDVFHAHIFTREIVKHSTH